MIYDIKINGKYMATVGPTSLEYFSVSVSTTSHDQGKPFLMASGMSNRTKQGKQTHTTWLQHEISENDEIVISPSDKSDTSEALKIREIRRDVSATEEDKFCDFCKQEESIVGIVIKAGETPYICKSCAELCLEIFKGQENDE